MNLKLTRSRSGRLRGNIDITYNDPFPTHNGSWGSGAIMGLVMHTEVGFESAVINEFNNPASQCSADFSIGVDGHVHQYGPVGKGWIAWAEEAGNKTWYSTEHEDKGNPNTPLTDAQILASAQILEFLSRYAGFPLAISDSVNVKGFGTHAMGGAAWGGHTCPDLPPKHVRSAQRAAIIAKAQAIRRGDLVAKTIITDGVTSLAGYGVQYKNRPFAIALRTVRQVSDQGTLWRYLLAGKWSVSVPKGQILVVLVPNA